MNVSTECDSSAQSQALCLLTAAQRTSPCSSSRHVSGCSWSFLIYQRKQLPQRSQIYVILVASCDGCDWSTASKNPRSWAERRDTPAHQLRATPPPTQRQSSRGVVVNGDHLTQRVRRSQESADSLKGTVQCYRKHLPKCYKLLLHVRVQHSSMCFTCLNCSIFYGRSIIQVTVRV